MINKNDAVKTLQKRYKYQNEYIKNNYFRLQLALDKDTGAKLQELKKQTGKSYLELLKPYIDNCIVDNTLANTKNNNNINN